MQDHKTTYKAGNDVEGAGRELLKEELDELLKSIIAGLILIVTGLMMYSLLLMLRSK